MENLDIITMYKARQTAYDGSLDDEESESAGRWILYYPSSFCRWPSLSAVVQPACEKYSALLYNISAIRCIAIYTAIMSANHRGSNRLGLDLSIYAPSFRLKQLAWGGYGFGHTSRREPGDVRGTVVGKQGRFRGLGTTKGGDA